MILCGCGNEMEGLTLTKRRRAYLRWKLRQSGVFDYPSDIAPRPKSGKRRYPHGWREERRRRYWAARLLKECQQVSAKSASPSHKHARVVA